MISVPAALLDALRVVHAQIRDAVVAATERQQIDSLARVYREEEADTIYALDTVSEEQLQRLFADLSREYSFVLIAEGLHDGAAVFPGGLSEAQAAWRIIVDPIDGTRGLMYQKR